MTICIAAIAENQDVIAIADKKLTTNHGVTSVYEINENKKIVPLTQNCIALFAGSIISANDVLRSAKRSIKDTHTVLEVANIIQKAYSEKLREAINIQVLQKYGLDIDSFNAQQRTLDETFVASVVEIIGQSNLGIEILIVGKDEGVPQLFCLNINGAIEDNTPQGYSCIGSGSNHANLSLIESEVHAAIAKESMVYAAIKAKKRAEYDPNVGHMSTLVLINDTTHFIDDEKISELWAEYEESVKSISIIVAKSSTIMKGIVYGNTTS